MLVNRLVCYYFLWSLQSDELNMQIEGQGSIADYYSLLIRCTRSYLAELFHVFRHLSCAIQFYQLPIPVFILKQVREVIMYFGRLLSSFVSHSSKKDRLRSLAILPRFQFTVFYNNNFKKAIKQIVICHSADSHNILNQFVV